MRSKWRRFVFWFRNSQYSRPTLYLVIFFLLAGILTVVFEMGRNDQFNDFIDGFWWLIITFSTTGYGDKVPVTIGGRIIAVATIIVGIAAASLLSGGLASWLVDRNTKARRGLMDFKRLRDHLVICGWKSDMADILLDILDATRDLTSDKIVLISNVDAEKVEELKEIPELSALKFVRGDYYSESALDRASLSTARKVMVLADSLESSAISEVDSKTVMTVLTIKSMARDVYVTAEVLDKKFASYLKQAMCDEILFSRDFSRRMLASSSATNGMSHIIYELLSQEGDSASQLATWSINERFVNASFGEYRRAMSGDDRLILGILENTGSPARMKMESLREAQKTSDVSKLITNLQKVKGLETNKPVFLPPDDYVIQRHSLAIVLERVEAPEDGRNERRSTRTAKADTTV
ncbi:MAG: potassium channel family protein [Spirochaetaceae bacterium]